MEVGDRIDHYDIVRDEIRPGSVVHVHAGEVALVLLDQKRRDGGNWYAMHLLNPPKDVHQ